MEPTIDLRAVGGGAGAQSLAGRALLAVLLLIGFYVLAIAVAVALVWICYAIVVYGHRIPIKLILICLASAAIILWNLIPRVDRFVPPGPRLEKDKHPKLFAEIERIAQSTGQATPEEVYLEPDVNAWVAQRGGVMGIGSRRIMGLGLPLMRVLSVAEFRAVLALEFGHFYGGDTKLGPWVHKTRSAIGRTVMGLRGGFVQLPFVWYGNMFLRVTHGVSRRQEFIADRLAATIAGKEALVSGLRKVHGAGMAFRAFWQVELAPVLHAGFRPPVAEGFGRFLQSPTISAAVDQSLDEAMKQPKSSPYDTHPPLVQRVAAVQDVSSCNSLGSHADGDDEAPAISLVEDVGGLERELFGKLIKIKLTDAGWDELLTKVYFPMWKGIVKEGGALLKGLTPETLPETVAASVKAIGVLTPNEQMQRRNLAVGASLALAAINAGGSVECGLGKSVTVKRGEVLMEPFAVVSQLASGKITAADWRTRCEAMGIAGMSLGGVEDMYVVSSASIG